MKKIITLVTVTFALLVSSGCVTLGLKIPGIGEIGISKNGDGDTNKVTLGHDSSGSVEYKYTPTSVNKKKETKEELRPVDEIKDIYYHWNNAKSWSTHRNISPFVPAIKGVLNNYSTDEVKKAIDNYVLVYESKDYYFSHLWTLKDFLNRGFLNFIETADPLNNYKANNGRKSTQQKRANYTKSERDEFINR